MIAARLRSVLDHPELLAALDQLVREDLTLIAARSVIVITDRTSVAHVGWTPFTPQECVLARQIGWDG